MGHYMRSGWPSRMVKTENVHRRRAFMLTPTACSAPWLPRSSSLPPRVPGGAMFLMHHQDKMGTMDPTFNPVITDNSPEFREKALKAMESSGRKCSLLKATGCWSR